MEAARRGADRFYLLLTTDHGMSTVERHANLEKMLDLPHGQREVTVETGGPIGNVFLDQVPAVRRAKHDWRRCWES